MHLFIHIVNRKPFVINVDKRGLVMDIKRAIYKKKKFLRSTQYLFYENRLLNCYRKISHYDITNESIIHLRLPITRENKLRILFKTETINNTHSCEYMKYIA